MFASGLSSHVNIAMNVRLRNVAGAAESAELTPFEPSQLNQAFHTYAVTLLVAAILNKFDQMETKPVRGVFLCNTIRVVNSKASETLGAI